MIPRGIPIAQIDADTELDSKFQRLARTRAAVDYYAAFGAYMSIVLRAWGTASRVTDPDLVGLIPDSILQALIDAHLLDPSGSIPEDVFDRRVGIVLEARRKDAERKRTPAESRGVQRSPQDSNEPSSPLLSSSSTPTTTPRGNDGEVQEGLDDPVVTYYTVTTRYPKGNALAWVKRLGDTYGFSRSTGALHQAWAAEDNIGTLLSRAEDILVASERTAELREKADERERLRQKRATRRAPVIDPGPEKVDAIMGDIRKALGR